MLVLKMPAKTKVVKRAGKRVDPGGCVCAELSVRNIIARPRRGHFADCALDANDIPRARACAHGCVRVGAHHDCPPGPEDLRLAEKRQAALDFVRGLARDWVREGRGGDEPGAAQMAHELLDGYGETVR